MDKLENHADTIEELKEDLKVMQREKAILGEKHESAQNRLFESTQKLEDQRRTLTSLRSSVEKAASDAAVLKQSLQDSRSSDKEKQVSIAAVRPGSSC